MHDEERDGPAAGQAQPQHRGRAGRPGRRRAGSHLCGEAQDCHQGGGQAHHAHRQVQGRGHVRVQLVLQGDPDHRDNREEDSPRESGRLLRVQGGADGIHRCAGPPMSCIMLPPRCIFPLPLAAPCDPLCPLTSNLHPSAALTNPMHIQLAQMER